MSAAMIFVYQMLRDDYYSLKFSSTAVIHRKLDQYVNILAQISKILQVNVDDSVHMYLDILLGRIMLLFVYPDIAQLRLHTMYI